MEDNEREDARKYFSETYNQINDVLRNPKNKVLVHCFAGKSRSTTILVSYLMKKERAKRDTVLEGIQPKRPIIKPNPAFMKQLLEWQKDLQIV